MIVIAVTALLAAAPPTPTKCPPVIGAYDKSLVLRRDGKTIELKTPKNLLPAPLEVANCSNPTVFVVVYQGQNYIVDRYAAWVEQDIAICNPDLAGTKDSATGAKATLALDHVKCAPGKKP
ncbi:MAG: hypothetical protein WC729_01695 [Sphingomonas sp.]|jgi:hypothetical protein|uniref:hypothetical protein n=1 Tax=Sphingomonas sp. TaxID=28214 RepID=UPI0035631833